MPSSGVPINNNSLIKEFYSLPNGRDASLGFQFTLLLLLFVIIDIVVHRLIVVWNLIVTLNSTVQTDFS